MAGRSIFPPRATRTLGAITMSKAPAHVQSPPKQKTSLWLVDTPFASAQVSPQANVTSSNAWGSTVHIPIHSNAGTSDCTSPYNYANGGSWLMYKPGSTSGSNLSQRILDQLKGSSPGTTDLKNTDEVLFGGPLHELRATNMPSAYVEAAFHTFRPDVD